jgi:hypothetical protein
VSILSDILTKNSTGVHKYSKQQKNSLPSSIENTLSRISLQLNKNALVYFGVDKTIEPSQIMPSPPQDKDHNQQHPPKVPSLSKNNTMRK